MQGACKNKRAQGKRARDQGELQAVFVEESLV